ncbi:BQ2448_4264 [Microbotryum intermedium]|uniref:BQ2448_4264 protein n=1 Tax=Microbotryum intermedium TaxID=269621 RepID=A0A238FHL1_9BASI|nr:BQ2448_4264 [Microbotryum intermedium]
MTNRPVLALQTLLFDKQQQQQQQQQHAQQRPRSTSASNDARPPTLGPHAHQLDQSILESPIRFVASPRALSPVLADFHFPFHPSSTSSSSRSASRQGSPRPTSTSTRKEGSHALSSSQIFAQLDRIDQLQKQLAIRHAELEGVAPSSGSQGPLSPQPPPQPAVEPLLKSSPTAATEESSTHTENKEVNDNDSSICRADYDKLKKAQDDRRPRTDQMMAMLEELSTALKTFHALPTPMTFPQSASTHMSPVLYPKDRLGNEASRSRTVVEPSAGPSDRRKGVQRHLSYS